MRPRLLFISPRFLFPLDEGGKIRTTGILRALKGGAFDIILGSPAPADVALYSTEIASVCDRFVRWPISRLRSVRRLFALGGNLPVSVAGDYSRTGRATLMREIAARPDLVVIDFPHAAVMLPTPLKVPSLVFTHNVETEIFERHVTVTSGLKKMLWQREAQKMRAFEQESLQRCTGVVAVSERDAQALRSRFKPNGVAVIDTGVDLSFYKFHPPSTSANTIVFSGAMDSRANIDGIEFLMDEIWPLVTKRRPGVRMLVVGRNPPPLLVAKAKRHNLPWQFTGFVDDIRSHVLAGDISVIPLRVGSGTRLKAFEAMALGRPVVSTTLGVEGLAVDPGLHFLLADTADSFAHAILQLLDNSALRHQLANAARALLEERFSWSAVGRQFEEICRRMMAQPNSLPH